MESPKLGCVAGPFLLVLSLGLAATAQQNEPWKSKLCQEHVGSCGILVTFNPPLGDVLLVPNEVTVDVPLELGTVSRVIVSSYPLGTEMGDVPSEGFVEMDRSYKVGNYERFTGGIRKCTGQGSLTVDVYFKGFERYPMSAGVGGAIGCEQRCTKDAQCPSGQRCGFRSSGCESKGKCVVPAHSPFCIDTPGGRRGCDGRPVDIFCGATEEGLNEYTSAPANSPEP